MRIAALVVLVACAAPLRATYRPELSYHPPGVANDGPFVQIDAFTIRRGREAEAEALTKEHAAIDREVGVRHAWDIYTLERGGQLVIMQVVRAASREARARARAAAEALRGPRIVPLYRRASELEEHAESIARYELSTDYTTDPIALPDAHGLVTLDYIAFDPRGRVWVPAGNTGAIAVIDDGVHAIRGQPTAAVEIGGRHGVLGPSSVAIGDGVAYVGNRADKTICAFDADTLARRTCTPLAAPTDAWAAAPDAVVYVATTHELWITRGAPPLGIASIDKAITILDASLAPRATLQLGGSAEGYAVDPERGIFYTNLEETGETLAIDVRTRTIRARWRSGCAEPHGVAVDRERGIVFVACDDRVIALDATGAPAATLETGPGVDNIDYAGGLLYVASEVGTLTIARVVDASHVERLATIGTANGARSVIADSRGTAYVIDPRGGRILAIRHR